MKDVRGDVDALGRNKPIWPYAVTWGTMFAIVQATSTIAAIQAVRDRDAALAPGRVPLKIHARRATTADLERWETLR